MIVYPRDAAQNQRFLDWAVERVGWGFHERAVAVADISAGCLNGVAVYSNDEYDERGKPVNIELSVIIDRPVPIGVLREVISRPFQNGFARITARIDTRNHRCRKLAERFGFIKEGCHPCARRVGGQTRDVLTYGMTKGMWKRNKFNAKRPVAA